MLPVLTCLAVLCLSACRKKSEPDALKPQAPKTEAPSAEARPLEAPRIEASLRILTSRWFTGRVGPGDSLTFEVAWTDSGPARSVIGHYHTSQGPAHRLFGETPVSNHFDFNASPGGHGDSDRFQGNLTSIGALEGHWRKYRLDSTYDSLAGTWKVEPRETAFSFTLAPDTTDRVPIVFETHTREARRPPPDTIPSSLELTVPRIAPMRSAADSALNEAMLQSVLAFFWCCGDSARSGPYPRLDSVMGEFLRLWKKFDGFFSDDYRSEVLFNEQGILSLELSMYAYAGGAHGSGNTRFASFDVKTGKPLSLEDILNPGYGEQLGFLAGLPNCLEPNEEYPCTAEGVVEHGFAFTREGLMFHKDYAGYKEDLVFTYGQLAQFARKHSLLDLVCRQKRNAGH